MSTLEMQTTQKKYYRKLNSRTNFDIFLAVAMVAVCFITLYPVWYTVVISFNDAKDALRGGIYWWPRIFSLESYKSVFMDKSIMNSFVVSIARTVVGTITSVLFTAMVGYAFSKKHIMGNKFYLIFGTITMFFSGGLIPQFVVYKNLGLYNSFWVYILPSLFNFYNMIIFMSFFRGLPASLEESAKLDGAGEFRIYWTIVMPLVKPAWITLVILNFQSLWNTYGSTTVYREDLKMLSYAINQIASAGVARTGTLNAVQLVMIIVPIAVFIFSQSNVMETMAHSGMK